MIKRYHFDEDDRNIFGCREGEYVYYDNYANLDELCDKMAALLERYSSEIPLENQPYMLAHKAAAVLDEYKAHKEEGQ